VKDVERFSAGRTFLLGFGFLGVSVIWAMYSAYVPIFLKDIFHLRSTGRLLHHESGPASARLE
jgi:hypothetical protein